MSLQANVFSSGLITVFKIFYKFAADEVRKGFNVYSWTCDREDVD